MTVERMEGTEPREASADDGQGEGSGPTSAEADQAATTTADASASGVSAEDGGAGTADPDTDAALGSSGSRALGEADQVAARVDAALGGTGANGASPASGDGAAATAAPTAADTDAAGREGTDEDSLPQTLPTGDDRDDASVDEPGRAPGGAGGDTGELPASAPDSGVEPAAGDEPPAAADATAEPATAAADATADPATATDGAAADPLSPAEMAAAPDADAEATVTAIDTRPEPTTMEELLSEQTGEIRSLKHGDVVEGNVVRIDKDEILVDIGAKSEGVVSNRELYGRNAETQPQLNIGDTVLVYVLQPESEQGHAVLSLRRAGLERKWRAMQEQLDAGTIIEAPVIDHNKGGLIVDCGIRGFVPISQIVDFPRRPQNEQPRDAAQEIAEKLQPYVGRRLRLKILEVNRKANRLILSEKVALYEERREKRDELFSSLKVGQRVTGSVRSIAPFGVFVDLGGIDGLVHKSELSWNKVNNPENGYKVGEEVEAEVIDINHERGRISLSIRRLQPDPWHSTVADLKVGDLIDGTVTKIVNFGAFVRVRDGLEGLIHISELSHQRVAHPGDVVHEGQRLKLKIISLDSERHRLGLSLKQAEEAPARAAPSGDTRGDRRGKPERSYDPSQAVQEPEGGIDNTLAAAFAQVRAQIAGSEQERAAADAGTAPEMPAGDAAAPEPVVAEAGDEPAIASQADLPKALDVPAGTGGVAPGEPEQAPASASDGATATEEAPASADTDDASEASDETRPSDEATPTSADEDAGAPAAVSAETSEDDAASTEAGVTDTSEASAPASPGAGTADDAAAAVSEDATRSTGEAASEPSPDPGDRDPAEGSDAAAPTEGADREQAATG